MASEQQSRPGELAMVHIPSVLLSDVLHEIAQPLTVLAALLTLSDLVGEAALTGEHLAIAGRECHRAIQAVRSLQVLSALDDTVIDTEGPR